MTTTTLAVDSVGVLLRHFGSAVWRGTLQPPNDDPGTLPFLAGACPIHDDGRTLFYWSSNPLTAVSSNNDACHGLDWTILLLLTVMVHALSWGQRWLLWEPLARWIAKTTNHPTFDRDTCRKVSMNLTEGFFFVASGVCAVRLFSTEPWLYQPEIWLQGREEIVVPAAVKCYYLLYMARFVSDYISLFFEVGRTTLTLLVSCLHHTVTLGLIGVALWGNYVRAAAVIMVFFDWADPPLLLAKTCKYMSTRPDDWFQTIANRLFEVFAVTFFLTRNVLYNYVTYQLVIHLEPGSWVEQVFLYSLVALQTYWLALIVQAVVRRQENDGNVEDVREDNAKKEQ